MKFTIQREALLKPLQLVCGVVERRQTLPILSHVLMTLEGETLSLTATDLEVEMVARTELPKGKAGAVTVPARKFMDICRALPDEAQVELTVDKERAVIRAGRSRFTLATLPVEDFPSVETVHEAHEFEIPQSAFKRLIEKTHFAMAQQDVRYYLNGLMMELTDGQVRAVATDGHRLALCESAAAIEVAEPQQAIVPRKGVLELARLLEDTDLPVQIQLGTNHMQIRLPDVTFTSKLIDGRFPDYQRVMPAPGDKLLIGNCAELKHVLTRASILSNEKYRGVRLQMSENLLKVTANNPEQEEAEDELEVEYQGDALEIGFNVSYLLDALGVISTEKAEVMLSDSNSSCLIQAHGGEDCRYVVMPMRL